MNFKPLTLLTILAFLFSSKAISQVYYPFSVQIVDNKSGTPIKNASIAIKELGYQFELTGADGKVYFSDVPVGEIHYIVTCEGFNGLDGTFNITSEVKSNTLRLELAKTPTQKTMFLLTGEVVNTEGRDVNGATVELRAGKLVKSVKTDQSGNFFIEIDLNEIQYQVDEFLLEVTKNDCKLKDEITIPKNNNLYKEIIIDCSDAGKPSGVKETKRKEVGEWLIELKGCDLNGNSLRCNFTFTSRYQDRKLSLSSKTRAYDDFGNVYSSNFFKIANREKKGGNSLTSVQMIANTKMDGNVVFPNISTRAQKITVLDLELTAEGIPSNKVQFRDITFK